jgi:hypothetical protein
LQQNQNLPTNPPTLSHQILPSEKIEETIEVSRDAVEPIIEQVRLGLFNDENVALKNLVLNRATAKISCFDSNISENRSKYKMGFIEFKRRIEEQQEEEIFEEWDDFIIWDHYESACCYWTKAEIRRKSQGE